MLIVSDEMIADMESNKTVKSFVAELFLRGKKIQSLTCFYFTILF